MLKIAGLRIETVLLIAFRLLTLCLYCERISGI
jgi:hypothetical protein